jgi:hypothetical protein
MHFIALFEQAQSTRARILNGDPSQNPVTVTAAYTVSGMTAVKQPRRRCRCAISGDEAYHAHLHNYRKVLATQWNNAVHIAVKYCSVMAVLIMTSIVGRVGEAINTPPLTVGAMATNSAIAAAVRKTCAC